MFSLKDFAMISVELATLLLSVKYLHCWERNIDILSLEKDVDASGGTLSIDSKLVNVLSRLGARI